MSSTRLPERRPSGPPTTCGRKAASYLESLGTSILDGLFTLVHGSLREPLWEYLDHKAAARENAERQETPYCLVGHTHVPVLFAIEDARELAAPLTFTHRGEGAGPGSLNGKFILNPGSVGQPRDGDPRAAYVLLDPGAGLVDFRRVEYAVERTQRRMNRARLPGHNAARLAIGR